MKTEEKIREKLIKIFIYLIWLFLIIAGIIDSFNGIYNLIVWIGCLAFLIILYLVFKQAPLWVHFLVTIWLLFSIFGGGYLGFFYSLGYYDKILHLTYSIIISVFVYYAIRNKIKNKKLLLLFCFFTAVSLGVFWEIAEYIADSLLGSTTQGLYNNVIGKSLFLKIGKEQILTPLEDTMQDIIFNTLGGLFFLFFYYITNKSKKTK